MAKKSFKSLPRKAQNAAFANMRKSGTFVSKQQAATRLANLEKFIKSGNGTPVMRGLLAAVKKSR